MVIDDVSDGCLGFLWSLIVEGFLLGTGLVLLRLVGAGRSDPTGWGLCAAYMLGLLFWGGVCVGASCLLS